MNVDLGSFLFGVIFGLAIGNLARAVYDLRQELRRKK